MRRNCMAWDVMRKPRLQVTMIFIISTIITTAAYGRGPQVDLQIAATDALTVNICPKEMRR